MSNRDREKSREYKRNQEWGVLIADDEPTHLLIMKRLIARQGYRVDVAATIEEAIEKLCTGNFRLLITDWGTPAIDGVSLCRHVRRNMQDMYVYTIILSARDMIEHIVTGLRSGADDYLTKPVFEPELLARLQTGKRVISLEKRLKAANDELRELTLIDPLTLLRNRRFLDDELPRLVDVAAQKLAPLSVVMCDIDHFKRVNDTYGHAAGDDVIKHIAALVQERAAACAGWAARCGGEEFALVLPSKGLPDAIGIANEIRVAASASSIETPLGVVHVTCSFGVAELRPNLPETAEQLISRADAALYVSKRTGRDRVSSCGGDSEAQGAS